MFDIKWIRANPDAFDTSLKRRGDEPRAAAILEMDDARRAHVQKMNDAQARRNSASKEIGKAKGQGDEETAEALMKEVADIKSFVQSAEDTEREMSEKLNYALSTLPNILLDEVPDGVDENDNVDFSTHGEKRQFNYEPKQHFELGEASGEMDFNVAAKMSGARFVVTKGKLARLERAIGQYMIDSHINDHGLTEVNPPVLVREEAMFGSDKLPKFAEDSFKTTDGLWLIPTSEVSLVNLVREDILDEADLPLRFAALTLCFRSEAGSAGRDTRGMIRQHQFTKVEMVSVTTPDTSLDEQMRMLDCAENILKGLGLHYRVILLCSGDTGFGAKRTYDIEVWLPGQDAYREISSVSTTGDFQARRLNARMRDKQGELSFVHTLNGSGLAVGRTLVAIMENYQNEDGSVSVPDVLQKYMGDITHV